MNWSTNKFTIHLANDHRRTYQLCDFLSENHVPSNFTKIIQGEFKCLKNMINCLYFNFI